MDSDSVIDQTRLAISSCIALLLLSACVPDVGPGSAYRPADAPGVTPIEEIAFKPIEKKDVLVAFNRDKAHDILYVLNLLKGSPINFEALEVVACAVERCDSADENWNWDALGTELVRINLIDVLLQADHNGFPILDANELFEEVLAGLESRNPQVVQRSLLTLGFRDEMRFAPEIERVAKDTTNDTTFRVAIIALKFMSPAVGEPIVARIRAESNSQRQAIINDVVPVRTTGGSE